MRGRPIKEEKPIKKKEVEKLNDIDPNDPYGYNEKDPYGKKKRA